MMKKSVGENPFIADTTIQGALSLLIMGMNCHHITFSLS